MKETKLLSALLPSSPDFVSIIETVREKYKLPESAQMMTQSKKYN